MKGKKGLDYIDWSISMGIFIIAIIALFIFLRPATQTPHDQDTLLQLVEDKFMQQTQWYVHATPIYMKKFADKDSKGSDAIISLNALGDIQFTAVKPSSDSRYEPVTLGAKKITFNCHFSCDDTNFTIVGTTKNTKETIDMEAICNPSSEPGACTALLGATITQQGIKRTELDALKTVDYATLKASWTYHLQRDFAIYQNDLDTTNKIIGADLAAKQGNVFVREIKTNILDGKGGETPLKLIIQVW